MGSLERLVDLFITMFLEFTLVSERGGLLLSVGGFLRNWFLKRNHYTPAAPTVLWQDRFLFLLAMATLFYSEGDLHTFWLTFPS